MRGSCYVGYPVARKMEPLMFPVWVEGKSSTPDHVSIRLQGDLEWPITDHLLPVRRHVTQRQAQPRPRLRLPMTRPQFSITATLFASEKTTTASSFLPDPIGGNDLPPRMYVKACENVDS